MIVLAIVLVSAGIGYSREYRAQTVAAGLQARVRAQVTVLRERRDGGSNNEQQEERTADLRPEDAHSGQRTLLAQLVATILVEAPGRLIGRQTIERGPEAARGRGHGERPVSVEARSFHAPFTTLSARG